MIALTALALAGRPLSAHVLAWCVSRGRQVRPGIIFIVTMMPIAVGALVVGATISPVPEEISQAIVQILIGLGLGAVFVLAEWSVYRYVRPATRRVPEASEIDAKLLTDPAVAEVGGTAFIYRHWSTTQKMAIARPWALPELCLVAIIEEVLYRGVVGFVALSVETPAASIGLMAVSAVLFGLSHDAYGAPQIALKTVYAAVLGGATLLAGSLLPAVVAHLVLNAFSWAQNRHWMRAVQAQQRTG